MPRLTRDELYELLFMAQDALASASIVLATAIPKEDTGKNRVELYAAQIKVNDALADVNASMPDLTKELQRETA